MSNNILSIDLTKDMEKFLKSKSKEYNLSVEETLKEILSQQINSRIDLGKGFYYDKVLKKVFDRMWFYTQQFQEKFNRKKRIKQKVLGKKLNLFPLLLYQQ